MALRALILRKKLDDKRAALEELRAKDEELEQREKTLEDAVAEAATEEDMAAAEGLVSEFDADKKAHEDAKTKLNAEIDELERDLATEEAKSPEPSGTPNGGNEPPSARSNNPNNDNRKDDTSMSQRTVRGFGRMDMQQRSAFVAREDVKDFLQRVREMGMDTRAVTGAQLTIPDVMLELLRENITDYSKLVARVNYKPVSGKARQNIMGAVPEGIWTEAVGTLNELEFGFSQVEVDGYMVGGFIPIYNATAEDSDLNLAGEIMDALNRAIGYALDKAILYGTGTKMPMGVVPRLAQAAKPSDWPANAPAWKALNTSNVKKLAVKTGKDFFKQILLAKSAAKAKYSRGELTFVMNEATKDKLVAEALEFNAAGAIVSGINNTMPVTGGAIITLDFVPDDDIIFGYFDLYLLAERAGATMEKSEHVRFLQNQTVFKGVARYDGAPVIGEAFGVLNVNNTAPTTSVNFAPDKANAVAEADKGAGEG